MRYNSKRSYSWSSELAYCIGLLASDGCLQKDGRHIDLTSIDHDQLVNFCSALGRDINITHKSSGAGRSAERVQFSDVTLYDFLIRVGLTTAKSKTMGNLHVPDAYYADFLRGVFDGDGTCYGYYDKRWRSSFMFYIGFTSASPNFISYLIARNMQLAEVGKGTIKRGHGADSLYYAKSDSIKIAKFMYYRAGLPLLKRKKDKLDSFIATHQNAILKPVKREW